MTPRNALPPDPDDLPRLYQRLLLRIEKLEAIVQQLKREGSKGALQPSWRDLQTLQADIEVLRKRIGA